MKNLDLGQLFIIGIQGPHLSLEEKQFIVENNIGGVVLFPRNIVSPQQVFELCQSIQALSVLQRDKCPLFIAIDMEGGRVARLKHDSFTQWPSLKSLGIIDSPNTSFQFANMMGVELHALGINLNFAPCADILTEPENLVIGDRSIGSDVEKVSRHVSALIRGYIKANIIPCPKHFPGHGNTRADSHLELPIETTDQSTLSSRELVPFRKAIRSRAEMIMTSHIIFKQIDPDYPVTFSKKFIQDFLRTELRFQGLIISDDLDMKALRNHYSIEQIPAHALLAGVQLLLYCNEPQSVKIAWENLQSILYETSNSITNNSTANTNPDELNSHKIHQIYQQIIKFKQQHLKIADHNTFQEVQTLIRHPDHLKLVQEIADKLVEINRNP